jgi:hypothetical protein
MSTEIPDPLATLAEALWPYLERKLSLEEKHAERGAEPAVMNRKAAAAYLGMTPNGLRKRRHPLLRSRQLPGYSRPLYFRRDLDAWVALGRTTR